MKNYELIATINPGFSDGELVNSIQKIKDLVSAEGGETTKSVDPIKKSLGYKVKGKHEAFIVSLNISLAPEKVALLNEKMKKESSILRSIVVEIKKHKALKEARTLKSKKGFGKTTNDVDSLESEASNLEHKPETQKVEMKEIDQKIEEILSE